MSFVFQKLTLRDEKKIWKSSMSEEKRVMRRLMHEYRSEMKMINWIALVLGKRTIQMV